MDGLVFYKLINILKKHLISSKLNKLCINKDSVFFSFYNNGLLNFEYRASPTPPIFKPVTSIIGESHGVLSAIHGAVVVNMSTFSYERVCFIELKKRKQSGKILTYKLILEPIGNYANFFLLSSDNTILYSLSSRTIDSDRNIGVGGKYNLPKANKKYSLLYFDGASSFNELLGFYPITAKYADMMLQIYSFKEVCDRILNDLETDLFYIDKKNKVIPFYIDNANTVTYDKLDNYFCINNNQVVKRDIAQKIKKIYSSKRDKYMELANKLEYELNIALKYGDILKEAQLIKNNLYKVYGFGKHTFEEYLDNEIKQVEYNVEYGENLHEKSDKLFKKATKLKRSIPLITERLQEAMQFALFSDEQIYYADMLSEDELLEFDKLINNEKNNKYKQPKKTIFKLFLEYQGDGFNLYIGKNSTSNHELVFKFAKSDDVWLHARNIPSAHGIIRLNGRELNDDILYFAAGVIASYSKYNMEKSVDIDYTYKKYVTKPKNTPVGFVTYKNFKTINVVPYSKQDLDRYGLLKENNQ